MNPHTVLHRQLGVSLIPQLGRWDDSRLVFGAAAWKPTVQYFADDFTTGVLGTEVDARPPDIIDLSGNGWDVSSTLTVDGVTNAYWPNSTTKFANTYLPDLYGVSGLQIRGKHSFTISPILHAIAYRFWCTTSTSSESYASRENDATGNVKIITAGIQVAVKAIGPLPVDEQEDAVITVTRKKVQTTWTSASYGTQTLDYFGPITNNVWFGLANFGSTVRTDKVEVWI